MITPSFSLTATERVLPAMALDFTTASLDGRVTFTRALATATRTNSSGLIEAVAADTARFDYDPVTLACKGLLIEESRINVALQSEDFTTTWANTRSSISSNVVIAPDGTLTGDKLIEDATAANNHFTYQNVTTTAVAHTFTVYAKAAERGYVTLYDSTIASGRCFDLITGVVGVASGATPTASTITDVGNGWYRCSITVTATAASNVWRIYVMASNSASTAYSGDGTSGIYIWGAQLEAGAFATSYIPTTTTALTRNADVATMTGTNFSDWFNASEGTLACEFGYIGPPKANGAVASINNNTTSNRLLSVEVGTTSGLIATSTSGFSGATIATMVIGNTYSTSLGVNTTQFAFAYNGNATTQQAGTINATAMTQLEFGGLAGQSTRVQNIYLKNCYYYPQRLTNNEIRATSK